MPFKREIDAGDRISRLPDDIVVFILSRLPTKVAARTSLLSRRWRWVWTSLPRLDFDSSNVLRAIKNRSFGSLSISEFIDSEKVRFVSLVNRVVESYPLPAIDEFNVSFDLNRSHKHDIDKWVKFLFEKKAKRIGLDFSRAIDLHLPDYLYTLSPLSLGLPSCIPLTSLVLKSIKVGEKVLHNLISNSPFLEHLCKILTFVPQLQKLALNINDEVDTVRSIAYPLMNQLRHMELRICADNVDSLLFLSSWIKACPSLHRFTLDVSTLFEWRCSILSRKIKKSRTSVHHSLKLVEITGFVGLIELLYTSYV
ncbi:hypothetical protein GQ457_13G021330 [Hibiscus cannabinus]